MTDLTSKLAEFPCARLITLPTPFEPVPSLTRTRKSGNFYIKRDDCTGLAFGGNKTRKLQYEVGRALREDIDTLVTTGGIQSNHARQTAAFAAKLGLRCELVLQHVMPDPPMDYQNSGNVLLDRLLGAKLHIPAATSGGEDAVENLSGEDEMEAVAEALRDAGRRPYVVPLGASTPTGALGYVECAQEITAQAAERGIEVDWVVLASGSAGTQAGLVAGFKALGKRTRVLGVAVSGTDQQGRRDLVTTIASETAAQLGWPGKILPEDAIVDGDYVGEGYGLFGEEVITVIRDLAQRESLLFDPVYTGKALLGLSELSRQGFFAPEENVVFLHTGGLPGLFAYTEKLTESSALQG